MGWELVVIDLVDDRMLRFCDRECLVCYFDLLVKEQYDEVLINGG